MLRFLYFCWILVGGLLMGLGIGKENDLTIFAGFATILVLAMRFLYHDAPKISKIYRALEKLNEAESNPSLPQIKHFIPDLNIARAKIRQYKRSCYNWMFGMYWGRAARYASVMSLGALYLNTLGLWVVTIEGRGNPVSLRSFYHMVYLCYLDNIRNVISKWLHNVCEHFESQGINVDKLKEIWQLPELTMLVCDQATKHTIYEVDRIFFEACEKSLVLITGYNDICKGEKVEFTIRGHYYPELWDFREVAVAVKQNFEDVVAAHNNKADEKMAIHLTMLDWYSQMIWCKLHIHWGGGLDECWKLLDEGMDIHQDIGIREIAENGEIVLES